MGGGIRAAALGPRPYPEFKRFNYSLILRMQEDQSSGISASIEHVGLCWRIRAGMVEEYDRRHARMWPALERRLRELGLIDCTVFRSGRLCIGHYVVRGSWDDHIAAYELDPLGQAWEAEFGRLIEPPDGVRQTGPERLVRVWSLGD